MHLFYLVCGAGAATTGDFTCILMSAQLLARGKVYQKGRQPEMAATNATVQGRRWSSTFLSRGTGCWCAAAWRAIAALAWPPSTHAATSQLLPANARSWSACHCRMGELSWHSWEQHEYTTPPCLNQNASCWSCSQWDSSLLSLACCVECSTSCTFVAQMHGCGIWLTPCKDVKSMLCATYMLAQSHCYHVFSCSQFPK